MSLKVEFYLGTDIGLRRENNQDSLLVNPKENIFLVADGLGGHSSGEVASSMALESVNRFMNKSVKSFFGTQSTFRRRFQQPRMIIKRAFEEASKDIFQQGQRHIQLRGMGTTLVMLWMHQSKVYIGNVGDSRAYLFREDKLWQLTDDHSLDMGEVKQGFEEQEMIIQKNQRSALTQSVGLTEQLNVDILDRDIKEGDTYLLCTDGLHGLASDQVILNILKSEELKNVPKKCIIKALSLGGWDNIALIVAKIVSC